MLFLYSLTLFISAALLFLLQLMVAKMILPSLGGTSSVWTVCMLFFQTILLMGYLYAQLTISRLGVLRQSIMHSLIILIPVAVLPAIASLSAALPASSDPTVYLLLAFASHVGVPFFCALHHRSDATDLVCQYDSPGSERPLFPLLGK